MHSAPCPSDVLDALRTHFPPEAFIGEPVVHQEQTRILVTREAVRDVLAFLKTLESHPFDMFCDCTAIDFLGMNGRDEDLPRFEVRYNLYSVPGKARLIVGVQVPEDDCVCPSALPVYKGAVWTERETHEMYGIVFEGHGDMRRLLTPDYFDDDAQYPLRKDYPLHGKGARENFPVYDPAEELDMSRFGYDQPLED